MLSAHLRFSLVAKSWILFVKVFNEDHRSCRANTSTCTQATQATVSEWGDVFKTSNPPGPCENRLAISEGNQLRMG